MILANFPLTKKQSSRFGIYYYCLDQDEKVVGNSSKKLIFNGYLYPDCKYSLEDLFRHFSKGKIENSFTRFKGRFCGIFIDKNQNKIIIFNDKLGLNDLFYLYNNKQLIITNKFVNFFSIRNFTKNDLDIIALAEFLLYEHVFLDRTFIKDIKLLRYANLKQFSTKKNTSNNFYYWKYRFRSSRLNKEQKLEKLDSLFKQAAKRIHKLHPNKKFLLGLSGGLDSRLVAKYAVQEGMTVRPFVFGHQQSDSFKISKEIAKKLSLKTRTLVIKSEYWRWRQKLIRQHPMMNLMYSAYCSVMDQLDQNKTMLTGFNGDNLFGSHINKIDFNPKKSTIFKIKKKYNLATDNFFSKRIIKKIDQDLQTYEISNTPDWQRKEIFNYENRQLRFIKNSPSFTYCGKFSPTYSIFADIDVVEFALTLTKKQLYKSSFYHDFFKTYHPELATIRPERKPYSISDHWFVKLQKKCILKSKMMVKKKLGIDLPFFSSIKFSSALDWNCLFNQLDFESELRRIDIPEFNEELLELDEGNVKNIRLKFHYLTIQHFLEMYIDD